MEHLKRSWPRTWFGSLWWPLPSSLQRRLTRLRGSWEETENHVRKQRSWDWNSKLQLRKRCDEKVVREALDMNHLESGGHKGLVPTHENKKQDERWMGQRGQQNRELHLRGTGLRLVWVRAVEIWNPKEGNCLGLISKGILCKRASARQQDSFEKKLRLTLRYSRWRGTASNQPSKQPTNLWRLKRWAGSGERGLGKSFLCLLRWRGNCTCKSWGTRGGLVYLYSCEVCSMLEC